MRCADARPLLSRRLDGELESAQARALDTHLAGCPSCRAYAGALESEQRALRDLWAPVSAPAGFAARLTAGLPPSARGAAWRLPRLRLSLPAAAATLVLLLAGAVLVEPVRAGVLRAMRHVVLRETDSPEPERVLPLRAVSLEEAQRLVPWRIRVPGDLPPGYRLAAVTAGEIHSFAVGPTITLHYQQGEGQGARRLRIAELQARERAPEPVEPGAAREVAVAGRTGLLIDGEWVTRDGQQTWQRGTLLRLILEDGDLVIQLEADPRDGWDPERLVQVAASLR